MDCDWQRCRDGPAERLSRRVRPRRGGRSARIAPDLDVELESDAEHYSRWVRNFGLDDLVDSNNRGRYAPTPPTGTRSAVELKGDAESHFRVEMSTEAWFERPPRTESELASDARSF